MKIKTKFLIIALITTIFIVFNSFLGVVKAETSEKIVAKIGEEGFTSIKEAVDSIKDTKPTTITVVKDSVGEGIIIEDGKNITFDFGGHTYTVNGNYAGSTGTKSQAFQLIKGCTIVMKNGTLKIAGDGAKMIIQNYCDLTLTDMTVDSSENSNVLYALSSNNGKVLINGKTSILASKGNRAFDMCWATNTNAYLDGTQITVDTTGTVEGIIELDTWGDFSSSPDIKSTLTIKNINHIGEFMIEKQNGLYEKQLSILGGKFTSIPTGVAVLGGTFNEKPTTAEGYTSYKVGNTYVVDKKATLDANKAVYVEVGKTADLGIKITTGLDKYLTTVSSNKNIATVENGKVTGVKTGKTTVTYTLADGTAKTTEVTVLNVEAEDNTEEIKENVIEKIISGEKVEELTTEQAESIKEAIEDGKTIAIKVEIDEISKNKVLEDSNKVENLIDDKTKVAGYFDINVLLKDKETDTKIVELTELPNTIKLTLKVEDVPNVAEGYTRVYSVIRVHDGKAEKLETTDNGNGTISFMSDKFSTYALAYTDVANNQVTDTNITNPKTGDTILIFASIFAISTIGAFITILKLKRS